MNDRHILTNGSIFRTTGSGYLRSDFLKPFVYLSVIIITLMEWSGMIYFNFYLALILQVVKAHLIINVILYYIRLLSLIHSFFEALAFIEGLS